MAVDQDIAMVEPCRKSRGPGGRRGGRSTTLAPRLLLEEVMLASKNLGERDRALVKAVYERGLPLKAVAAITHTHVGRLQRRLQLVMRRLRSPLFRLVVREQHHWPADRRAIAQAIVLQGRGQREIAGELGLSLHRVRTEMEHLKALAGTGDGRDGAAM